MSEDLRLKKNVKCKLQCKLCFYFVIISVNILKICTVMV